MTNTQTQVTLLRSNRRRRRASGRLVARLLTVVAEAVLGGAVLSNMTI